MGLMNQTPTSRRLQSYITDVSSRYRRSRIVLSPMSFRVTADYSSRIYLPGIKNLALQDQTPFCKIRPRFVGSTFMDTGKKKSGLITVNLDLCWGNPAGKIKKVGISFPEKWYLIKKTVGKAMQVQMTILVPAIFAMDQTGNLYASNTQKYNIQRVSLKKGEIIGKFGRRYSPVRYRVEESAKKKIKPLVQPPKFFNDVQKLIIYQDYLWVLTSTVEKGKGVLVDVFTKEGKYIDNFYLPLPQLEKVNDIPRKPICLYKNFLFTVATDKDDQPVLIKYLIDLTSFKTSNMDYKFQRSYV